MSPMFTPTRSKMHPSIFQNPQTQEIINFVKTTYGDELEFLWPRTPSNAIWRNRDNQKWYAALLTVKRSKLWRTSSADRLTGEEIVEILDLRFDKGEALDFADGATGIYPGYHMNKQNWITVILDGSLPTATITDLLKHSHDLASA